MPHWIWKHKNWPEFTWQNDKILQILLSSRQKQGKLLGTQSFFDKETSQEMRIKAFLEESMSTSAIEGEKINPDAVRSSIAKRLGLPTFGLPAPSRQIDGLIEILYDATVNYNKPLTLKRLFAWQAALFPTGYSGLTPIKTGDLRGKEPMQVISGPIEKEFVHFEAPPQKGLKKQLEQFIHWFNNPPDNSDGFIRAGIAHLWFITLHPFADGNGRIARAITDMALAQDEKSSIRFISLSAQIMKERKEYYNILEKTQRNGLDITPWLKWFLQQLFEAYKDTEKTMESILIKTHFWQRHQDKQINARQRKALNCLLDNLFTHENEMKLNTRKYTSLTKTSRATAYRELAQLVELKCLIAVGEGRSSGYMLNTK